LVTAYLFSKDNLDKLKKDYPWIKIVESNEIRGFSENNNLALKYAKGEYCFILNDDTEMFEPVIDELVASIEKTPDADVMSPCTYYGDGRLQCCGRPRATMWTYILSSLCLRNRKKVKSPYVNQKGIFKTYTLLGAAFLIKTKVFEKVGWFDETYFFCPEDVALGQLLTESGYGCYVDSSIGIVHYEGGTWSVVNAATGPASVRGLLIFYSRGNSLKYILLGLITWINRFLKWLFMCLRCTFSNNKTYSIRRMARWNELHSIFTRKTPKELFIKYYQRIKR
jgi:GT2 family glycosyltransferase